MQRTLASMRICRARRRFAVHPVKPVVFSRTFLAPTTFPLEQPPRPDVSSEVPSDHEHHEPIESGENMEAPNVEESPSPPTPAGNGLEYKFRSIAPCPPGLSWTHNRSWLVDNEIWCFNAKTLSFDFFDPEKQEWITEPRRRKIPRRNLHLKVSDDFVAPPNTTPYIQHDYYNWRKLKDNIAYNIAHRLKFTDVQCERLDDSHFVLLLKNSNSSSTSFHVFDLTLEITKPLSTRGLPLEFMSHGRLLTVKGHLFYISRYRPERDRPQIVRVPDFRDHESYRVSEPPVTENFDGHFTNLNSTHITQLDKHYGLNADKFLQRFQIHNVVKVRKSVSKKFSRGPATYSPDSFYSTIFTYNFESGQWNELNMEGFRLPVCYNIVVSPDQERVYFLSRALGIFVWDTETWTFSKSDLPHPPETVSYGTAFAWKENSLMAIEYNRGEYYPKYISPAKRVERWAERHSKFTKHVPKRHKFLDLLELDPNTLPQNDSIAWFYDSLLTLNLQTKEWQELIDPNRDFAKLGFATLVPFKDRMFMFGGQDRHLAEYARVWLVTQRMESDPTYEEEFDEELSGGETSDEVSSNSSPPSNSEDENPSKEQ